MAQIISKKIIKDMCLLQTCVFYLAVLSMQHAASASQENYRFSYYLFHVTAWLLLVFRRSLITDDIERYYGQVDFTDPQTDRYFLHTDWSSHWHVSGSNRQGELVLPLNKIY